MSSAAIAAGRARELLGPERYDARRAEEAAMSVDEVVAAHAARSTTRSEIE